MKRCFGENRIHLILDYKKENVLINKCCAFVQNIMDSFTIEEFQKQNVYELCKSYFNNTQETNYYCDWLDKKCNCKNEKLESVEVAFSQVCNLNCNMCFMPTPHFDTELSKTLYFDTLYNLKGHKLKSIRLTDQGEPFFYKNETLKYLKSLTKNDFEWVEATSNLLCLDDDYIKELSELKVPLKLVVSFDTLSPSKFKEIRSSEKFDKFIHNFNLIKNYGMIDYVNSVYQKINVYEIFKMRNLFKNDNLSHNCVFIKDIFDSEHGLSESKISLINSKLN